MTILLCIPVQTTAQLESRRLSEQRTWEECSMLRRTLDQALAQIALMTSQESSIMVDRRVVAKLLVSCGEGRAWPAVWRVWNV